MIKGYKSGIRKHLKQNPQDLKTIIAHKLEQDGIVEVLAGIYLELYYLKKQLMTKGTIEPEEAYLMGEVYEYFSEQDNKNKHRDPGLPSDHK